ncbi:MAG: IclR family transcriptional regulator [Chloroflexales bacterium]|nr:IclR family transcriptional regulator [Chloroflexales bacterium]
MGELALVPAIDRAITILSLFTEEQSDWSITELHQRLHLPKSTVHGILATLRHHGYLERDTATQRYHLGAALLDLAHHVPNQPQLSELAQPYLQQLRDLVDETAFLGLYVDGHATLMGSAESRRMLKISAPLGKRLPVYAGCFGKLYLASLSEEACLELLTLRPLRPFTGHTRVDLPDLLADVAQVRRQGYATDDQEYIESVWAAGAPIYQQGRLGAAIVVVGIESRMSAQTRQQAIDGVLQATRTLTRLLER